MKRLIALIGAVAMSFGLFAEDATPADYYANSFETTTEGASSDGLTWSPTAQWSTTLTDAFNLGDYTGSEPAGVYGQGAQRRDGSDGQDCKFENTTTNAKFLKLETGTNTLDCATDGLDMSQGKFYFDQLVKFTGFEEAPTFAADTKIAVWMSAIETEGTPQIGTPQIGTPAQGVVGEEGYVPASEDYVPASEDYQPASDDYIAGETNLYVQVGTGTESVSVQIDPASVGETEFAVDKWYRITIKSIGDVVAESGHDVTSQLGFLVFINGKQAAIVDAPDYHSDKAVLGAGAAAKYYAAGQLFTAIDTTTVALAKVGYQGIGAIDDVVLSASSPDFDMSDEIEIEIASLALNGAKVIKIGDVTITDQTTIKVKPGDILVSYAANGPYIVKNGEGVKWTVAADGTLEMDEYATIEIIEGYATLNGVIKGEAELAAMMANLKANDTVVFLRDGNVTNDVDTLYSFTKNTQIDVAEGGAWTLSIMNVAAEQPGTFVAYADIANDITVAYENGDEFDIYANTIPAGITVDAADENGSVLLFADPITVAGTLKVNSSATFAGTITLAGAGSVWSATRLDASIFTNEEVAETGNAESGYTYALATEQPFVPSATVANDFATAIDYLKNNYYNKYTNGQKIDAPDASYVKVGTLASDVTGTVSIGGTAANADEKFSLSIGNNAFLESAKFKIVGREVYVAAVILAIEQVKVTANATDYPIESANSGNLELKSFAAVAPTTIAGEGTNFTIVRGDDKPLVKFFFTDTVTQYFVTKKTFIDKNDVATTSYGFTTPDEGGLWLYLGYGVGLGGKWNGVTYNYTVYAFGVDKKAITLSMSITDKSGELTSWDDVTDNTPIADLPCLSDADKTALAAAEVSATKVSAWAKGNGKVTIGTDTIKLEAFLLNVENTDTAIAAEKAAFKIPSITVNADGTVTVTEPTGSYNGTITIKGSTTPNGDFTLPVTDTSARFFKAFLGL